MTSPTTSSRMSTLQLNATVELRVTYNDDFMTCLHQATANIVPNVNVKRKWGVQIHEQNCNDKNSNNKKRFCSEIVPLDLSWKLADVKFATNTVVWKGSATKSISPTASLLELPCTMMSTFARLKFPFWKKNPATLGIS